MANKIALAFMVIPFLHAATVHEAQASWGVWEAPAGTCIPGTSGSSSPLVDTYNNGDYVGYATSVTSGINWFCAVNQDGAMYGPDGFRFGFAYTDPTGTTTGTWARAVLYRTSNETGTTTSIATVMSDDYSDTTRAYKEVNLSTSEVDFAANTYYVRMDMGRSSSSHAVRVYFADLGAVVF